VAAVVVFTLGAMFLFQLGSLALATRQAKRLESAQRAEVAQLATQNAALDAAILDAQSDGYVEKWARENKKMAQPGDRVLAPVPPTAAPVTATTVPPPKNDDPLGQLWRWLRQR
jgi:cell division protein FtsB